ncbi:MAG: type IV pilus secretin PilQ [Thermoanaerobaculia bacterium]
MAPAAPQPVVVQSLELAEGAPGMRIELDATGPLVWTSFRNDDGDLVIELPNSVPAAQLPRSLPGQGLVASLAVEDDASGPRPLTRLTVKTQGEAESALSAEGNKLRIDLSPVSAPEVVTASSPQPSRAETAQPASQQGTAKSSLSYEPLPSEQAAKADSTEAAKPASPATSSTADLGTPDRPNRGQAPGEAATRLDAVRTGGDGTFVIEGNGGFTYSSFRLDNPPRLVIDLDGVINHSSRSSQAVGQFGVQRVRVAQFRPAPVPVARVVFDLDGSQWPSLDNTPQGLSVRFGGGGQVATSAPPAAQPARAEPAAAAPAPAPQKRSQAAEPAPAPARTRELAPPPAEPSRLAARPASPLSAAAARTTGGTSDVELYGSPATKGDGQPGGPAPSGGPTKTIATKVFGSRTIGTTERTYYGDPLTMSMRDADLVETLRSFAALSNLSIVVQPEVKGTVTVELDNVPWDQALEQILKVNKLGYELEGTVMRIAPVSILKQEAEEQQALEAAKAAQVPLKTVMRRLSYAKASDVAQLLRSRGGLLSQRGSVILDKRTNTLILKELPAFMDTVIAVIDEIDTPEPQVMIEARIVETTKRFSRSLGVNWSFNGESSPRLGNTTGLIFPNQGTASGGVNLVTGAQNGFLSLALGNVLNSFKLDVALRAAENEGLIKILSAPKVAVLNNEQANIQSGLQIPIQTVANNTVTVQFVNATLSLDVTPHVTAEGTVLMDLEIRKREPQLAFAVQGAANAPISTKEARTRVIVRDGGTTVIGGIYKVSSDQGTDKVPGLANIPIIGHLFKNKRRSDENEELLIFITPRVINL